ncbi:hypothetical protein NE556_24175, partial [[Clostridium] symbiosum]|nr:hypothetical protein [[Clostridium] symbiosum]
MASSECFTALQQGTIDGLEQPVTPMYTYKSYELCKKVLQSFLKLCIVLFTHHLPPRLLAAFLFITSRSAPPTTFAISTDIDNTFPLPRLFQ